MGWFLPAVLAGPLAVAFGLTLGVKCPGAVLLVGLVLWLVATWQALTRCPDAAAECYETANAFAVFVGQLGWVCGVGLARNVLERAREYSPPGRDAGESPPGR